MQLWVPSMGSMTRVRSIPRSTSPASSLRTLSGRSMPSTHSRMTSSANLSMLEVGDPSAPV